MGTKLHASTKSESLDTFLVHLITLFENAFPERICSYYLGGSTSDGTAVGHDRSSNSSDVDLFIIFRGTTTEAEEALFQYLIAECQASSPVQIDAHAYSEDVLLQKLRPDAAQTSFLSALIQVAGVLVYGKDMRADLPPVQFSHYVLDVIESGVFHLSIPRQREGITYPLMTPLVFPLTYPDPAGEFYGYDTILARPGTPRGTRVLVALTTWIATFILSLETGRYVGQKSQSMRLCKEYLPHDKRVQLVVTIYDLCKDAWRYALPDSKEDRKQLRGLCRETLALENEYLRLTRDYIFSQLQHGEVSEKRQAIRILQSVAYQDDEMRAAVNSWQDLERA
ncbi:hypothetical protein [Tengunoibacter tsumagoiensis]|uniref:Polymerase nucleotidyl transferase domain-containing protein n=1 Tax=Tengunoibacter tsumagoiensis TaxID=2014871 RepID=A0A402A4A7_9CHLR|nr:hypothetical protein [Tengunoibacter tsumagoiensis]GCE13973.1 hypothetical protein KTT_38320 [Tengunoibacter tsumagoiensis]